MPRLLIANRAEIARRVIRTASRLGWHTIAVYTDLDRHAAHVREADQAVEVPSYLDIDAVVAAARASGAEFVHPGYGFLSERAEFARALESAGIALVGPSGDVMDAMGRKDHARAIAERAGVPVVPSYALDADPAGLDYPVLVKAAAGGGGKGMRIVRGAAELADAMAAASREAAKAFGDDTLLVEKYVESGRHVEVQIIADGHGNVVHLFERDCSAQRRHQKVVEEAPAPTITAQTRQIVLDSAVALAREVGYVNAGTVEFLVDNASGSAYFLEMNTRLQVEHPVTEMVTGIDLVEWQLLVATGAPLPLAQDEIRCEGHAIEARIYAEDAFGGFLPQAGHATEVLWSDQARVDEALQAGQEVTTSFDPMLGKVIVHAADRDRAIGTLITALDETAIFGLTTNTGFVRALVDSDAFRAAAVDTAWLDHHELPAPGDETARALWGWSLTESESAGPWRADGFRLGGPSASLIVDGQALHDFADPGSVVLTTLGSAVVVHLTGPGGDTAQGFVRTDSDGTVEVVHQGQRFAFERSDPFREHAVHAGDGSLTAPMPGTMLSVGVAEGDSVVTGQTLGVLEAMKMELALKAPYDGVVTHVGAVVGDRVALGVPLFQIEISGAIDA